MTPMAPESLNRLLSALPADAWQQLQPALETVDLVQGQELYASGVPLTHVYFPTTATVSLLSVTEDGATAEIAVVGSEGIVGIGAFMGGGSMPSSGIVLMAGQALRMNAAALAEAFSRSAPLMVQLLRYTQALISQMSQLAVCNRHHRVDQQLCRWLLLNLDRARGNELATTQERIANLLGVRREGVTTGALKLQRAGVIRYTRGHISVLDRAGLEHGACECYGVVRSEYERLLSPGCATAHHAGRHGATAAH